MIIKKIQPSDFEKAYTLAKNTPELRVSASNEFMDPDEFRWAIQNPSGVFLIAEEDSNIIGFIYANTADAEKTLIKKWACLVYIGVDPQHRKRGTATKLYNECIKMLKSTGITNIYGWANLEGDGTILNFMKKRGFSQGHKYMWVDKEI